MPPAYFVCNLAGSLPVECDIEPNPIITPETRQMKARESIISGSITRTIFALAIPPVLGMLMEFLLSITDFFWVGRLGPTAQDAITSSMVLQWTVYSGFSIISIGVTALVSRSIGANDPDRAAFFIRQAYRMAVVVSLVIAVSGFFLAPALLSFMGAGLDTRHLALPYLRIFFLSSVLFAVAETSGASFRASGDTKTPTIVSSIAIVINMILDPLFIFGIGPFPRLEVTGAAVATTIAIFIWSTTIFILLLRGNLGFRVPAIFTSRPDFKAMFKITRIGLPISSQQIIFIVVYWFLIKIVHEFGETAGAAMGIGNRMESFSYLTCYGFSLAAATMVGQNLGAGKPDRAARCAWGATGLAMALTTVMAVFFLTIPGTIAGIFTEDPQVRKIASDYLFILGLSQAGMAVEIVLEAAFSGAGNTIPPMIVSVPGSLLRIPLAYFLAFNLDWGINGVWWTLTFTTLLKAGVLAFWFRLGRWKTRQV